MKRILMTLFIISMLSGCNADKPVSQTIFAMDTVMEITAYTDTETLTEAINEINRLDSIWSASKKDSFVYKLNKDKTADADKDTLSLLNTEKEIFTISEGAFDPTVYPVVEEWGFISKDFHVPDEAVIQKLLKNVDFDKVTIQGNKVSLENKNASLDMGAAAKGYTSQKITDLFREKGVSSALVALGGNIQALGTKPDGSLWRIGIQDPDSEGYIGVVDVADKAVVTSGGYQRFFEENGVTYHHIINPKTGYPAGSGLVSATIVSSNGTKADCLSTAVFVMGLEKAAEMWQKSSDFAMILVDENKKIYVTEDIADNFTCETDFEIIRKEG